MAHKQTCRDCDRVEELGIDTRDIEIEFRGAGHYWLSDGRGLLNLGECQTEADVRAAVGECIAAGSGNESWAGWRAAR
jgi:hypothetical protein